MTPSPAARVEAASSARRRATVGPIGTAGVEPTESKPSAPVSAVRPLAAVDRDFDAFCRREHGGLTGLAYVLTGSWTAAEDLAQDALFAAFRQWDSLQSYDNPGAWVRRVVANRAISWRRRISSEARALVRLGGRRSPGPEHDEISEHDAELWALVRSLPPRQAQVFALTYVEDFALDQVAAILEISPGTAKTHLKRARAAIVSRRGGSTSATSPAVDTGGAAHRAHREHHDEDDQ